jgi:hypothetical protein
MSVKSASRTVGTMNYVISTSTDSRFYGQVKQLVRKH